MTLNYLERIYEKFIKSSRFLPEVMHFFDDKYNDEGAREPAL